MYLCYSGNGNGISWEFDKNTVLTLVFLFSRFYWSLQKDETFFEVPQRI